MKIIVLFVWLSLSVTWATVNGADRPVEFDSDAQQTRYMALLEELRCLVCQNQSLADSHAELAQDLRDQVYAMVVAGDDRQTIIDFMVTRYGDFVLYSPPVKTSTWVLWFGPLVLLLVAGGAVYTIGRRHADSRKPLSSADRARAEQLLADDGD